MQFAEVQRYIPRESDLKKVGLEYKSEGPKPGDIVYGLPLEDDDGKFVLLLDSDKRIVQIEVREK